MEMRLISLVAKKTATKIDSNTSKAINDVLLNGKVFRGTYDSSLSYNRGDIATVIDPILGPVIKEALYNIVAGTPYTDSNWSTPALGSPFVNTGNITLNNTETYPFNNSDITVVLEKEMLDNNYIVLFGYNDRNVEEVEVYDKQVNGFKVRYWGTTNIVNISYVVC